MFITGYVPGCAGFTGFEQDACYNTESFEVCDQKNMTSAIHWWEAILKPPADKHSMFIAQYTL